jgi:hypothetical protein
MMRLKMIKQRKFHPQEGVRGLQEAFYDHHYAMASTKARRTEGEGQDVQKNAAIQQADVMEPVNSEEMGKVEPLRSQMFSMKKFTAEGEFHKVKAWRVANGNEQDSGLYPNKSSPTEVALSILSCLTVVTYNNSYRMAKIDVKWTFIQTEMEGPPVYIKCNKKLAKLIMEVLLGLQKYVQKDGVLYCRLLKALYG